MAPVALYGFDPQKEPIHKSPSVNNQLELLSVSCCGCISGLAVLFNTYCRTLSEYFSMIFPLLWWCFFS